MTAVAVALQSGYTWTFMGPVQYWTCPHGHRNSKILIAPRTRRRTAVQGHAAAGLVSMVEHQRAGLASGVVGVISRKLDLSVDALLSTLNRCSCRLRDRV